MVEGYSAEEGRGQAEHPNELSHPSVCNAHAGGDVRRAVLFNSRPHVSHLRPKFREAYGNLPKSTECVLLARL